MYGKTYEAMKLLLIKTSQTVIINVIQPFSFVVTSNHKVTPVSTWHTIFIKSIHDNKIREGNIKSRFSMFVNPTGSSIVANVGKINKLIFFGFS